MQRRSVVYTIGHSNRTFDEFLALLKQYGVTKLIDVRSIPGSAANPQFNRETLPRRLRRRGIEYLHLPELGGRRPPRPDSPNSAWQNRSFQGYADYMQTPAFTEGLAKIMEEAMRHTIVLMCAEAVPWRCHRRLIADALTVKGLEVRDIVSRTSCTRHELTPWARVRAGRLTYPAVRAAVAANHGRVRSR